MMPVSLARQQLFIVHALTPASSFFCWYPCFLIPHSAELPWFLRKRFCQFGLGRSKVAHPLAPDDTPEYSRANHASTTIQSFHARADAAFLSHGIHGIQTEAAATGGAS